MSVPQYTIRGIPPEVDARLRDAARREGRSLNEVVVDRLARATGWSDVRVEHDDLEWFIGAGATDPDERSALDWLDDAPSDLA
jgi:hypothetical protein